MDDQTILKRYCDNTKIVQNAHTLLGDIAKIVFTFEDTPALYYQNFKIIVTSEKVRVIIHNSVGKEVIIDQTYPINSSQFLKAACTLESFQIKDADFQINHNCTEGFRKEISYYNNCGLLYKRMVLRMWSKNLRKYFAIYRCSCL